MHGRLPARMGAPPPWWESVVIARTPQKKGHLMTTGLIQIANANTTQTERIRRFRSRS
jgi:hypothetical protein